MSERNTYVADPESGSEMIRLGIQGDLLTKALGLFPAHLNFLQLLSIAQKEQRTIRVLDVGSGPGDWPLAVAALATKHTYSHSLEIFGIDISELMVAYANTEAENREFHNVHFINMDALKPMEFPSASFDVINIRIALAFVPRGKWPALIAECYRLLRPSGTLISIEAEGALTTCHNPATARMNHWLCQALTARGLAFWDGVGSTMGIHPMQLLFFRQAHFKNIQQQLTVQDTSFGTPGYWPWMEHHKMTLRAIEPIVVEKLGISKEDFDKTLAANEAELMLETYASRALFLAVTGQK